MYLVYCLMLFALMVFGGTHAFADGLKSESAAYRQIQALDEKLFRARVVNYDHLSDWQRKASGSRMSSGM